MANSTRSTSQQVKAAQNATKTHDWPEEAGAYDELSLSIYRKNQGFRSYDDWHDADLFELARISKIQAMLVGEMEAFEDEGFLILGGKNGTTMVENPRNRAIATASSGLNTAMRRLGMTSSASGGDRASKSNRADQERKATSVLTKGGKLTDEQRRSGENLM